MTAVGGLRIVPPEGFDRTGDDSRAVFLQGGGLRSPMQITVWSAADAPPLADPRQRALTNGTATFGVEETDGGSGGPVYVLRAFKASGEGTIAIEAQVQSEGGEPDFETAWSLLDTAYLAGS